MQTGEAALTDPSIARTETALRDLWRETLRRCSERFSLEESLASLEIVIDDATGSLAWPQSWNIEVQLREDTVMIPDLTSTAAPLIRGLLAREALRLMLPAGVVDDNVVFDVACEFGRQNLRGQLEQEWTERWRASSESIRLPTGAVYDAIRIFDQLERMEGSRALDNLVNAIAKFARAGVTLSLDDWVRYLMGYVIEFTIPLNRIEIAVADALLRDASTTREEIAARLGMTPDWIGKVVQRMTARGQLRLFERLSLRALNIRVQHILIEPAVVSQAEGLDFFRSCPFLYSSWRVIGGRGGILITLAVPDNDHNLRAVRTAVRRVARSGFTLQTFDRVRAARQYCFDYYDTETARWRIDWFSLWLAARHISSGGNQRLPTLELPAPPEPLRYIDNTDALLLSEFQAGTTTIRGLRDKIRCRTSAVVEKMTKFRDTRVLVQMYELRHAGLTADSLVIVEADRGKEIMGHLALRLPQTYVESTEKGPMLFRVTLPADGVTRLAKIVGDIVPEPQQIHLLDSPLYGGWKLGAFIEDWNFYHGTWAPHPNIDTWLEDIERRLF